MTLFPSFFVNKTGGYEIEQSLRFDGSSWLQRTFGNDGSSRPWTYSGWVKKSSLNDRSQPLIAVGNSSGSQNSFFGNPQTWLIGNAIIPGGGLGGNTVWAGNPRDYSAWYHWVLQKRSSTANDWRLYVNGVQFTTTNNTTSWNNFNRNIIHYIGRDNYDPSFLGGYLAELHFVDNQILDPTDFGELDNNGVWRPIEVSGLTYGTNGFYLKFDPSATNGIGHDHSGNGNNFTPTGFTTSGTGTDVMSDTPTTNYPTWNPVEKSSTWNAYGTGMSNGNLEYGTSSSWNTFVSTIGISSGKWYFELDVTGNSHGGFVAANWAGTTGVALADTGALGYNRNDGKIYENNNAGTSYGNTFTGTHTLGIAIDADNDKFYFAIDNTWQNSANPSSGTGGYSITLGNKPWRPAASANSCTGQFVNFGQRDFAYTPPTGFKALNTANLPAPDIADGSDNFQTVLDSGANILSSAQSTFTNGLWWVKDRANSNQHQFVDSLRGSTSAILSPSTVVAGTYAAPTGNSVAWCWNVPDTFTPTATGGLTSLSGRRNVDAGFSMVKYTGSGTSASFTHGLSQAPELAIFLPITRSGKDGATFVSELGTGKSLYLRRSLSALNISNYYGTPTSSDFLIGTDAQVNDNTFQYMCYLWHSVPGYSSIGSYTGNGNNDGPFVFLGFRPALILTKRTNSTSNWVIQDSTRQTYNPSDAWLRPNTSGAEGTTNPDLDLDFLSNGFKVRNNGTDNNISGSTYIFMALAENPFGGDGVSPATAR